MIVVISPAKKLDFENASPTKKFTHLKDISMTEKLIKELRKCPPEKISKMMKLSENLTELNVKRYKDFKTPFNLDNAKQAMFAFKGDTYVGLARLIHVIPREQIEVRSLVIVKHVLL